MQRGGRAGRGECWAWAAWASEKRGAVRAFGAWAGKSTQGKVGSTLLVYKVFICAQEGCEFLKHRIYRSCLSVGLEFHPFSWIFTRHVHLHVVIGLLRGLFGPQFVPVPIREDMAPSVIYIDNVEQVFQAAFASGGENGARAGTRRPRPRESNKSSLPRFLVGFFRVLFLRPPRRRRVEMLALRPAGSRRTELSFAGCGKEAECRIKKRFL